MDMQFLDITSKLAVPITIGSLFFYGSASLVTTHVKVEEMGSRISALALDQKIDRERSEKSNSDQDQALARIEGKLEVIVNHISNWGYRDKKANAPRVDTGR